MTTLTTRLRSPHTLCSLSGLLVASVIVYAWSQITVAPRRILVPPSDEMHFLRGFSPDGQTLFSFYKNRYFYWGGDPNYFGITLWDVATGKPRIRLPGAYGWQAFSRDGRLMAAAEVQANGSCVAKVWDVHTGQVRANLGPVPTSFVGEFTADSKLLVQFLDVDRIGMVWQNPPERNFSANRHDTYGVDDFGGVVRVWDLTTGRMARSFDLAERMRQLEFSSDGTIAAVTQTGGGVRLWGMLGGAPLAAQPRFSSWGSDHEVVRFSPDGNFLAVGPMLCDVPSGRQLLTLNLAENLILDVAFTADSKTCLTVEAGDPCRIRLWDIATGRERAAFPNTPSLPLPAAWKADCGPVITQPTSCGQAFAGLTADGQVLATEAMISYQPDPRQKPVSTHYYVQLWDVGAGREIAHLDGSSSPFISPDGKLLATTAQCFGLIQLWDIPPRLPILRYSVLSALAVLWYAGAVWWYRAGKKGQGRKRGSEVETA